ncbi:hypothetical protein GCM10010299_20980 [Streptomyces tanashiensis]|nr:hypothetical protein GCM10010299_20980 [Streptomyces tanashiensis]
MLITNKRGQVLLQRVTYRPTRLLPGGAVDRGEMVLGVRLCRPAEICATSGRGGRSRARAEVRGQTAESA